jgi:hypothetical protein
MGEAPELGRACAGTGRCPAALSPAVARDARERHFHQLRARGPAGRAAPQVRARCRRPHTWFDFDRLESGDDYDQKIRSNIARCSFFLPIISANTQRRFEGYFRREWSYAVDRSRNIAEGAVFILPVCIDDTPEYEALVPDKFKSLHITRLPGGEPSPEFLLRLKGLFSGRGA